MLSTHSCSQCDTRLLLYATDCARVTQSLDWAWCTNGCDKLWPTPTQVNSNFGQSDSSQVFQSHFGQSNLVQFRPGLLQPRGKQRRTKLRIRLGTRHAQRKVDRGLCGLQSTRGTRERKENHVDKERQRKRKKRSRSLRHA